MKCEAAIALVAAVLIVPVYGQHSGSHNGSYSGHGGMAGHSGSSSHSGFSAPRSGSISRPAAPARFGFERSGSLRSGPTFRTGIRSPHWGQPGMRRPSVPFRPGMNAPLRSGFRAPYAGNHFTPYRPGPHSGLAHRTGNWDHDRYRERYRGHDHDRHHGYGFNGFAFGNPGWIGYPYYPYPYVIDPGFYDWSDSSDSAYDQGYPAPDDGQAPSDYGYAAPGDQEAPPYPNYGAAPYAPQDSAPTEPAAQNAPRPAYAAPSPAESAQPLTVIFKGGRKPEQIRNYMLTATVLTDLDQQRYEQIPLDQIDAAATEQANRVHGIDFHVPPPSRD